MQFSNLQCQETNQVYFNKNHRCWYLYGTDTYMHLYQERNIWLQTTTEMSAGVHCNWMARDPDMKQINSNFNNDSVAGCTSACQINCLLSHIMTLNTLKRKSNNISTILVHWWHQAVLNYSNNDNTSTVFSAKSKIKCKNAARMLL